MVGCADSMSNPSQDHGQAFDQTDLHGFAPIFMWLLVGPGAAGVRPLIFMSFNGVAWISLFWVDFKESLLTGLEDIEESDWVRIDFRRIQWIQMSLLISRSPRVQVLTTLGKVDGRYAR